MRLDVADLHLFLCVVDAGSITGGARQAHLALASASERIRAIEADVGTALLHRHPRGISLTEAGAALEHHARQILFQQAQLRDELRSFAAGGQGTLRLYSNTAGLTTFLPERLGPWLAARPNLRVELLERTSVHIVSAVASGQVEAGLVSDAVDAGSLHRQSLVDDPLVVLLPSTHDLASRRRLEFADVLGQPFVALADGNALQDHIEDHARVADRHLDVRVRMKSFDGLCTLVGVGVGVGIVPRAVARQYRRATKTVAIPLSDAWARRQLCVCFAEWSRLTPAMRSLLVHLGATAES